VRDWEAFLRKHLALPDLAPEREVRIVRELAGQLEDFYRDALSRGLSESEADAYACRQIRDWTGFATEVREADRPNVRTYVEQLAERAEEAGRSKRRGGWTLFADLMRDVRYALRQLRRSPGFTAVAVLTLALGIGANTAIFSAVHAVLLRPFPYPDPDRLAVVSISWPTGRFWLSEKEVLLLREQSTLFEGFGALDEGGVILVGADAPRWLNVGVVSANVFPLLGIQPALGRGFTPEEEQPNGPPVVILSHHLWQSRFGGDPKILGRVLNFEGERPARVVGVMPRNFQMILSVNTDFHQKVDAWYPHQIDYRTADRGRNLIALARVKKGVTWPQAQEELDRIAKGFFPADSQNTYRAFPLQADTVREIRPVLLLLLAATGFVLLIVCANVANLLLARGATRQKEMAIRTALGATRARMIRQSLAESAVLALAGGGAGILLAWMGNRVLSSFLPANLPRLETIRLDAVVLGVSVALSLFAGFFFGVAPAFRSARVDVDTALKEGSRARSTGGITKLLRNALIVGEIALSLVLLVGGSLVVRSFLNLQKTSLGYNPSNLLTFTITLPSRYENAAARMAFFRPLQERMAGLPGVESVGGNSILPFGTSLFQTSFTFYGTDAQSGGETQVRQVLARPTLTGYFETLQSRLLAGRSFTKDDTVTSEPVAIIDETLAQAVWPGQSPIGKRIARGRNPEKPSYSTVVGVVENLRLTRLTGERRHQVFLPYSQFNFDILSLVVRTRPGTPSVLEPIRAIVHTLDPNVPLYEVGHLDQTVADAMAPQRLTSLLMTLFAAIGFTLALVGVYGVISYAVNQQTHEIGIRVALGAQHRDIYKMVLGSGLRLAAGGALLGLAGAVALSRTMESLLFGVSASDPASYAVVTVALLVAALAACCIPARRATRVDPMAALRYE